MHETEEDLAREEKARLLVVREFSCDVHKLPVDYYVDWVGINDGKIQFWGEFKYRNHKYGRFKDVILSANKYQRLLNLGYIYDVPTLFFVSFAGDIRCASLARGDEVVVEWGGRTTNKRSTASSDIEPVVRIPIHRFSHLDLTP